jgi:hypothetical protein
MVYETEIKLEKNTRMMEMRTCPGHRTRDGEGKADDAPIFHELCE